MKKFYTNPFFVFFAFLPMMFSSSALLSQDCSCVVTGNCPVPITDNGTFFGTLDVTVDGANDLGTCPLTSVCFTIIHPWVGDLSVSLISPGGANYLLMADVDNDLGGCGNSEDNVDVCILPGTGNPLTNNTEYVCNGACLNGNWTVPCGGVTDPFAGAVQAPTCDLDDFNTAGSPANGTWTLVVNDICSNDIGSLIDFSLTFDCGIQSCVVCEAEGGSLDEPDVSSCFGDPSLDLVLPPNYNTNPEPPAGEYMYNYVISQNGTIISINPTASMIAQPPGDYQICGISFLTLAIGEVQSLVGMDLQEAIDLISSSTAPFCADFSDDCVNVTIGPLIPPTILIQELCLGDCVNIGGNELCTSGSVTLESYLGCDSVIDLTIIPIFIEPTLIDLTLCSGECIDINGTTYCPPGPESVILESYQGCDSLIIYSFFEEITTAIIMPDPPPPIDCNNPSVVLSGIASFPATVTYLWEGPNGFTSTEPVITASETGTYSLTVENNAQSPPCTATAQVEVMGNIALPDLQVIGAPPQICDGETFDLNTLNIVDGNNTGAVITFHSATPANASNELPSPVVNPSVTTTYYILGTANGCTDETDVTLTVNPMPTADFTVGGPVCQGEDLLVTYAGTASPSATYNWNFGGGTATPGIGQGPHTVSWPTGGVQTVTLSVEENGCTSAPESQPVVIDMPLVPPLINCNPDLSMVEFVWDPIAGASSYNVTVVTGPTGVMTSPTSYLFTGLAPGDQVSIIVEAVSGNSCPNTSAQLTCSAQDCPPVTISIAPVADICLDGTQSPITLSASQTGGTGGGAFSFSGPGVNPITGVFDPDNADIGANTIVVTYEEGACQYNESIIINVYSQPSAAFTVISPICNDGVSTINYTGSATSNAIFTWDFNGGTAVPGNGPGPHTVTWPAAGNYPVSLMVEEQGCQSATEVQSVEVQAPLESPQINCMTTTSSIEFSWPPVAGATDYTVNVLVGTGGTSTSATSILFDNLNSGDAVTIEVVANGTGPCGNSTAQATCNANDCPPVDIDIAPVDDICLDGTSVPFDLQAAITGSTGGTLTWSGNGITNANAGTFDPTQASIGQNTVTALYEEGNCIYTRDITIGVFEIPVASFTTDAPACAGDEVVVTYDGQIMPGLVFNWDFGNGTASPGTGQGPHMVTFANAGTQVISLQLEDINGCLSTVFESQISIDEPLVAPAISCTSTTSSIEFTWPLVAGASGYDVQVSSGPTGTFTPPNSYFVSGLNPMDEVSIELTVSGNGACPPVVIQETCIAIDCPAVGIDIAPVPSICLSAGQPLDLEASISGGSPNGTESWTGTGITDAAEGIFDPAVAGVGTHTITHLYEEGNCSYENTIEIVVFAEPTADFTATPVICVSDEASIMYTGNASPDATYNWDFGTGNTGPNQQSIAWDAPGTYTITLTVEQDGCTSETFAQQVEVTPELAEPEITCNETLESIEFNWDEIPGATDYDVVVLNGPTGVYTPPNSYFVDGLANGDAVTIQVTVNGNTVCPLPVVTATCTANDCPDVVLDLAPVDPTCINATVSQINLTAVVSGGLGGGTGTWSGDGIIDAANGVFDITMAGVGIHEVTYSYQELTCSYERSMDIEIIAEPTADFVVTQAICENDEATITYTGNASASATYNWDFGTGTVGNNQQTISWDAPGTYTISLTVEQDGCVSETFSQQVEVTEQLTAPTISCDATTSSITFTWNEIPGASDYDVTVLSGLSGTYTPPATYSVDGLMPGEQVSIQVAVNGNTLCPPPSAAANCAANDCPDVQLALTPIDPVCLEAQTGLIELEVSVSGGTGNGTGIWTGAGVANGIFDPSAAGAGTHVLTYTYADNSNCFYSETISVELIEAPVADAGMDVTLTCEDDGMEASIGGNASSAGSNITYQWTAGNNPFPGDSTILHPTVSQPGTYTLTVTNTDLGCSDTDVVVIGANQEIPVPEISIVPVSCFGENDGAIFVTGVTGGTGPYLYSLNGAPFGQSGNFTHLVPADDYELVILDANGCENMLTFDISQPQEVGVELIVFIDGEGNENIIRLGESVDLTAEVTVPEDSLDLILWEPAELINCDTCLQVTAAPTQQTTFSITVENNGCSDSDAVTIFVSKDRAVYVPNAFSPNGDNINDIFMINAKPDQVTNIKSFLVFNRWGETVFQYYNFAPNNPMFGWDGKFRGQTMNPAVFTWFAEIEFIDGVTELIQGDVSLVR
ncbi:MAG TPA: T9SS type B sorting domain-containing protein [Bacteroidetes bacterium]|nr:T9SS type B sorting domain-containing protein [Bacteroidota bacterium]